MSPIERAARAICEAVGPEDSSDVRSPMGDWPAWQDWKPAASAVLRAFDTPEAISDDETDAAMDAFWAMSPEATYNRAAYRDSFRRAIVAALRAAAGEKP